MLNEVYVRIAENMKVKRPIEDTRSSLVFGSAGSIPGFVRYRSIPEFCSIPDTRYLRCKSSIQIEHSSQ